MDVSRDLIAQVSEDKARLDGIPELGWHEDGTSRYIQTSLGDRPIFSAKNSLVYAIGKGKSVFFRAELDALATPSGVKHVCGHSAHMAALMGAYRYFRNHPVSGYRLLFLFQPCEEGYPSGAQFLSTKWKGIRASEFGVAFHTFPGKPAGALIVPTMAGCDYMELSLAGKSTHIKNKYSTAQSDCLIAGSELAVRLNSFSNAQAILNIGILRAGETPNSISGSAFLAGDVRWLDKRGQLKAKRHYTREISYIRKKYPDVIVKAIYNEGYPQLVNDTKLLSVMHRLFPIAQEHRTFATEDFSLYPVRKLFLLVATGETRELHEEKYAVPDRVVIHLLRYWIALGKNIDTFIT